LENPKISLIEIKDIMPKGFEENYNTNAIEAVLYKIPGLEEHFLIGSDDYFVNKPLDISYFFNEEGKPIQRLKRIAASSCSYSASLYIAYSEIFKVYNP
jgi:hypothetical protein